MEDSPASKREPSTAAPPTGNQPASASPTSPPDSPVDEPGTKPSALSAMGSERDEPNDTKPHSLSAGGD